MPCNISRPNSSPISPCDNSGIISSHCHKLAFRLPRFFHIIVVGLASWAKSQIDPSPGLETGRPQCGLAICAQPSPPDRNDYLGHRNILTGGTSPFISRPKERYLGSGGGNHWRATCEETNGMFSWRKRHSSSIIMGSPHHHTPTRAASCCPDSWKETFPRCYRRRGVRTWSSSRVLCACQSQPGRAAGHWREASTASTS